MLSLWHCCVLRTQLAPTQQQVVNLQAQVAGLQAQVFTDVLCPGAPHCPCCCGCPLISGTNAGSWAGGSLVCYARSWGPFKEQLNSFNKRRARWPT